MTPSGWLSSATCGSAALVKSTSIPIPRSEEDVEHALKQIVSKAVVANGVADIFQTAVLQQAEFLTDDWAPA